MQLWEYNSWNKCYIHAIHLNVIADVYIVEQSPWLSAPGLSPSCTMSWSVLELVFALTSGSEWDSKQTAVLTLLNSSLGWSTNTFLDISLALRQTTVWQWATTNSEFAVHHNKISWRWQVFVFQLVLCCELFLESSAVGLAYLYYYSIYATEP